MAVWNAAWELLPKNSQSPTEADDNIRSVKTETERRMRNEHDTYNDATGGAQAADWRHKEGSARCWYESAEPANSPSAGTLAAGHLWVDSDDKQMYVYDGAAFQSVSSIATYIDDQGAGANLLVKVISGTIAPGVVYGDAAHGLTAAKIRGWAVSILNTTAERRFIDRTALYGATQENLRVVLDGAAGGGNTITFYATIFYIE